MQYNGQAFQDLFALKIANNKKNGYFIEIGSSCPIDGNNTYILENQFDWKGLMVEHDSNYLESYKIHRPNSIHLMQNAVDIDYTTILKNNNFPNNIDYLQIDLEVENRSTLDLLKKFDSTVFNEYKFAAITFEHDIYRGDFYDTRIISREIFKKRGYVLVFPDVIFNESIHGAFEDWWVHPDLCNMDYVNTIKTEKSLPHNEIKNILNN